MNKQELNKCAQKLHEAYLKTGDYSLFDTPEYSSSWAAVFMTYGASYYKNSAALNADLISKALMDAIKNYDIERGCFENFFNKCIYYERMSALKKEGNKASKESSFDFNVTDNEGNDASVISLTAADKETYDIESRFEENDAVHNLYLMASELALKRPSGNEQSKPGPRENKAMFYKKLVFTDMMSSYPLVRADAAEFFSYNKTKLGNSVDIDFANSYYVRSCRSVTDFLYNTFRDYSEFTHDPKHEGRPCVDEANFGRKDRKHDNKKPISLVVLYTEVYISYVQAVTGQGISKGQISEKRNGFFAALYEAFKTENA